MTGRIVLAVHPTAGRAEGAFAAAALREELAGVSVVELTGPDGPALLAATRSALREGADALVVVGGDGTVHLGVNLVAGTSTPLGILPTGTGNDIARGLGLTVTSARAAARELATAIRTGRSRTVDAARCRGIGGIAGPQGERWFAGVLGAGFDALVNERANGWRRPRGHLRYDLAILRELPVLRPRQYVLSLDGEPWTTPAVMVVVANGPAYGGGMRICPDARMDDGLLDVLVVAPLSRTAFLRIYPRVYAGTHVTDPRVTVRRARCVTVACAGIVAYGDGERLGALPLTVEVVPQALRVLTA